MATTATHALWRSREMHSKSRPLLLCVEDNEDSRTLYATFLTRAGFRVAEACNGAEGLERAERLHPDLIVLDISLPVLDGREVLTRLRQNPDLAIQQTPVIVVTGGEFPRPWRAAIDEGCDTYLAKPCPLGDLLAAVLKTISRRRSLNAC